MKRTYSKPKFESKEYSQLESVFTLCDLIIGTKYQPPCSKLSDDPVDPKNPDHAGLVGCCNVLETSETL